MTSFLGSHIHTHATHTDFSDTLGSSTLEIFTVCLCCTVLNDLYGNFGETIHLKEPISMTLKRYGRFRSE